MAAPSAACSLARHVNLKQVRSGMAWRFPRNHKAGEFTAAEADAREQRRGFRGDPNPVPAWEWRREKRAASRAAR
jgi:micrococcal nuclease